MKRLSLICLPWLATALAGPALAQDSRSLSGFYVGGHVGYMFGNANATLADPGSIGASVYPAFSIIASVTLRFSTISRVTSNSFTFFWLGKWYMRSSINSSRIMRKPRAPTLRAMA